jgi:hypothetical protein
MSKIDNLPDTFLTFRAFIQKIYNSEVTIWWNKGFFGVALGSFATRPYQRIHIAGVFYQHSSIDGSKRMDNKNSRQIDEIF